MGTGVNASILFLDRNAGVWGIGISIPQARGRGGARPRLGGRARARARACARVRVCVRACARACARVRVCACVCACARACARVRVHDVTRVASCTRRRLATLSRRKSRFLTFSRVVRYRDPGDA